MKSFELDRFIGQTLNGHRLEQLLSHGRLSAVYQARQLETDRAVALTVLLLPETTPLEVRQQFCSQFLNEAQALTKLHHPNLLPLYGCGEWESSPYLVTPYTTEGSLAARIGQEWSPASILPVLEEVTAGLAYAHRNGQVHGMLTPANVLLSGGSYQVAAIGISHLLQKCAISPYTEGLEHIFTPKSVSKYMAPEYQQEGIITIRSDIYSLGVILVELFAGHPMTKNASTQEILARLWRCVPAPWQPVLQRALATNPTQRFQRINDLFVTYAALLLQEEEQRSQPAQLHLIPTSVAVQPDQETEYYTSPHRDMPDILSPRTESVVFSVARIKAEKQSRQRTTSTDRRRVTAIVAGGIAVGIVGIGGINLARAFTDRTQATAPPTKGISQTSQAINSAVAFNDTRLPDQRQRLLIHLPDGKFVAYKQGCTHTGVLVNYDPKTHLLVCPAHGAIFDPAQNGKVIMGPATMPLPKVAIQISSTGAITLV